MRDYFLAKKNDLLVKTALKKIRRNYTLVVVGDDPALGAISNSNLPDEEKLKLLCTRSHQRQRVPAVITPKAVIPRYCGCIGLSGEAGLQVDLPEPLFMDQG